MSCILEAENLTKKFEDLVAVNNISLSLFEGEIVGLLGPNGSGKTTTIKMLLGLIKPTSGTIIINGDNLYKNFNRAISNIGAIVETPNFYPYLSGYDNLMLSYRLYPNSSMEKLDNLIKMVGLKDRIHDPVKKYSLGMKQRLGICRALIGSPKILFLDEPINGLDPIGIAEFRDFITNLAVTEKVTILISSHILSEIEKVCNRVIIINKGTINRIVELNDNRLENIYRIKTDQIEKMLKVITDKKEIKLLSYGIDYADIEINEGAIYDTNALLVERGIRVESFFHIYDSLETNYISLLKDKVEDINV